MKITIVTIVYSSTACIKSLAESLEDKSNELECEIFLHSRRDQVMEACAQFAQRPGVFYHPYGLNRGISTSWNDGMLAAYGRNSDAVVIANDDVAFAAGDIEKLAARAIAFPERYIVSCAGSYVGREGRVPSMGYSCFAINPIALKLLGCFDQNIFPAYCEDQDYAYRARLAGLEEENCADTEVMHVGGCSVRSDPGLWAQNALTWPKNLLYYHRKWGGPGGRERFRAPFNDARFGVYISPENREYPYGPLHDRLDQHIVHI